METKNFSPTIGLEIHTELKTNSKMFCGCPSIHFGKEPNTQTCPVCLGLPGALPVPNKKAIEWTIMLGLALGCEINKNSKFDRKHYFYPDLPKGYQISQYDEPLCVGGFLETSEGKVRIRRVHIEEDTGKLVHKKLANETLTLIDFNRSGVPLVEIVTEPDIKSGVHAKEFAQLLQQIIRTLGISDCDMEKGSMRLEANVSWGKHLGYKVEVKNLNSFRFVEKAINYELVRQKRILEGDLIPKQETRGWSEKEEKTSHQRYKETEADYRYFPDPDIPPLVFTKEFIEALRKTLPELPAQKKLRLSRTYGIRDAYLAIIVGDGKTSEYAEKALELALKSKVNIDQVAGEIVNKKINLDKVSPLELIERVKKKKDFQTSEESEIRVWVKNAIESLPIAVKDYKKGKVNAISALIGKVMQFSKGRANPSLARKLLEEELNKL